MADPGPLSLLPALVTIAVAVTTQRVALALFCGLCAGAAALASFAPLASLRGAFDATAASFGDLERLEIAAFILVVGALLELLSASGAYGRFASALAGLARTPRRARVATWGLGLSVFFDDYANVLLVGATMRGALRRLSLSPALLAYLVDQVATVVSVTVVSTWAAFEGSLAAEAAAGAGHPSSPTALLVASLPFHASTWLGILLAGIVAFDGRWFGRLLDAPLPAATASAAEVPAPEARLRHVLVPLGLLVGLSVGGLAVHAATRAAGGASTALDLLEGAPTVHLLLGASLVALLVAAALLARDGALAPARMARPLWAGLRHMVPAALVIVLSKGLADVSEGLGTGPWLTSVAEPLLFPGAVPAAVFVVALLVTVATGFSWSSMAILMPVACQLAVADGGAAAIPVACGAVICGSITGGLMVPWSDTSVMTAAAVGITPVLHARTQLLQALPVALASVLALLLVGQGWSAPAAYAPAVLLLVAAHLAGTRLRLSAAG